MSIGSRGWRRWLIAEKKRKRKEKDRSREKEVERNDERKVSKQDVNICLTSFMIRWKKFGWFFCSNFFFFFNRLRIVFNGIRYIYILPLFPFKNLKSREEQLLITVLTADTSYFI